MADEPKHNVSVAFGWAITVLAILLNSSWSYIFVKGWKKNDPKIVVRNPYITLFFNFAIMISICLFCSFLRHDSAEKVWGILNNSFVLSFILAPYMVKTFELYHRYNLAEEIFALKSLNPMKSLDEIENVGWFLRNRFLISLNFQVGFIVIWSIICFLFSLLGNTTGRFYADLILSLIGLGVITLIFWRMKGKVDAWGIKKELRNVLLVGSACLIVYALVVFLGLSMVVVAVVATIVFCGGLEYISFECVARPALTPSSITNAQISAVSSAPVGDEFKLDNLMKNKGFMNDFESWLVKALSAENLSFVKAIQQFEEKILVDGGTQTPEALEDFVSLLLLEASTIIRVFVNPKGAISLNLSSATRHSTMERFEGINKMVLKEKNWHEAVSELLKLFDNAKKEAYHLLETDSLPRYMATDEFKKFREVFVKVGVIVNPITPELESSLPSTPSIRSLLPIRTSSARSSTVVRTSTGGTLRGKMSIS